MFERVVVSVDCLSQLGFHNTSLSIHAYEVTVSQPPPVLKTFVLQEYLFDFMPFRGKLH